MPLKILHLVYMALLVVILRLFLILGKVSKLAFNNNVVDLSSATTFNVADLRLAFQIQKFMERNAVLVFVTLNFFTILACLLVMIACSVLSI